MQILKTSGVCAKKIGVKLNGNIVEKIEFFGGCDGNTIAIEKLVQGMTIDEVVKKLEGIDCSERGTSCPDQLAKLLKELI